jgi:hypothetical protein
MKEVSLTLEDFKFRKTNVDIGKIEKYDDENQFMSLAVELFKEVSQITCILSCAYRLDDKNNPRKWSRDEAILGGLMIRLSKLQIALLDQVCQKRLEIANIIFRCIGESLINLRYLLGKGKADLYEEYIEYSLREEKRLLNKINTNIGQRGYELPIETRMKKSIEQAFHKSSFSPDKVDETKWKPWGDKIFERAKKVNMEEIYFAMFSLPSHAVHGNWQDLITYHLDYENGEFAPKTEWGYPRPQPLFAAAFLSAEINELYLDEILPECSDKNKINEILDDIIIRVRKADELHEQFMERKGDKE